MNGAAQDAAHMARALQLAHLGLNTTSPNPRVGCVIARTDGTVAGEGWHVRAGGPHAEVHALRQAGAQARGATAYVTLEPCAHHGRTPPCADALIEAGVARVVAAMQDPNPLVAGQGLARLRAAGIATECGLMGAQAEELNIGFVSRMRRGRPWLRLKLAASLDGGTALENGASQWITGPAARADGHRWRARACALLTGRGTVLADDPQLTVRGMDCERAPVRVVVDARLDTPPTARLFDALPQAPLWIVHGDSADTARAAALTAAGARLFHLPGASGRVDLPALLAELAGQGINEVHTEAGSRLNGALLAAGCVDELLMYYAPLLLGRARGMFDLGPFECLDEKIPLRLHDLRQIGEDIRLIARI